MLHTNAARIVYVAAAAAAAAKRSLGPHYSAGQGNTNNTLVCLFLCVHSESVENCLTMHVND